MAHLIGANNFKAAREVLRQALASGLVFSGIMALIGVSLSGPLPHWLGGSPEIMSDSTRYIFILAACLPFMQIDWMCASMLQVSGNMKVPSYLNIGMCVLDVCFNYLFIYVLGMGVIGAAIGTGLAEFITAMAMLYFVAIRSPELNLLQDKGSFLPTAKVLSKATGIGGPMALQNVLIRGGYIASTVIVAPLGTIAIAANSFAITAESFCYMPGYAASIVAYGVCVGAGDTKWPSVMNFTSMWIVRILPAIFLVKVYGLVGFWIAMAVELTFRGAIFLVRIAQGKWLEKA